MLRLTALIIMIFLASSNASASDWLKLGFQASPGALYKANALIKTHAPDLLTNRSPVAYQINSDPTQITVKYSHQKNGVPIFNEESFVHITTDRFAMNNRHKIEIKGCSSNLFATAIPTVSRMEAQGVAVSFLSRSLEEIRETELMYLCDDKNKFNDLIYRFYIEGNDPSEGMNVIMNAHSGKVMRTWLEVNSKLARRVRELIPIDIINRSKVHKNRFSHAFTYKVILDEADKKTSSNDQEAMKVYDDMGLIHDYFYKTFKRDSYNGKGAKLESIVHYGKNLSNAFFHSKYLALFFGDGDGVRFKSFTSSLGVIAHEYTHMIVYATSRLRGSGETGSLNESISDFFALQVTGATDWRLGHELFMNPSADRYVRDMKRPEAKSKPGHYKDRVFANATVCNRTNDNCGAHRNVGIPNKAAVFLVETLGAKKTEQIYYHALLHNYSREMKFKDAKTALRKSCESLNPNGATDCGAVDKAWSSVGVN